MTESDLSHNVPQINHNPPLGESTRIHKPYEYLQAYHWNLINSTITIYDTYISDLLSSSAETCKYLSYSHKNTLLYLFHLFSEPSNYDDENLKKCC